MAQIMALGEAVAEVIHDGDTVALEGFTHLIPFAAGHEIIRQQRRDLELIRLTPDLIYDQLIGMGCARKLTFSWGGNPGVGSLHRLRDAVEHAWPAPLAIDERSHAAMANAFTAGASGLPFAVTDGLQGTSLLQVTDRLRPIECPFTGRSFTAVSALTPDVTVIHAQQADAKGNVLLWGIVGLQKEAVLAARRVIVTVEELVADLSPAPNACVLPHWVITAVAVVPGGAYPSYAHDYYERDNGFYQYWDQVARDRESFLEWMDAHIMQTRDFAEFRQRLAVSMQASA